MNTKFDAILIPGGGVKEDGALPIWTKKRINKAIEIFSGEYIILLSAGSVHKPPVLDINGYPVFESIAAAKYLIEKRIDSKRILIETCSLDTIGNAYFSRVIHVDPRGFRNLLVITSEFHLQRTIYIFNWIYSLNASPGRYRISYESVSDNGILEEVLKARKQKEKRSLKSLHQLKGKIQSMQQFHEWFFTQHSAYSVAKEPDRLSGKVLDIY